MGKIRLKLEYLLDYPDLQPEVFEYDNCVLEEHHGVDVSRNADGSVKELVPSDRWSLSLKLWSGCDTFEEAGKSIDPIA